MMLIQTKLDNFKYKKCWKCKRITDQYIFRFINKKYVIECIDCSNKRFLILAKYKKIFT